MSENTKAIVSPVKQQLGPKFRIYRLSKGKSAKEIALKAKISPSWMSVFENDGDVPDETVDKILAAGEITREELITMSAPQPEISLSEGGDTTIRALRKSRTNLNVRKAAEALNIKYHVYLAYELGYRQPSPAKLLKIANFFGVEPTTISPGAADAEQVESMEMLVSVLSHSLNEKIEAIEAIPLSHQALIALQHLSESEIKDVEEMIFKAFAKTLIRS